MTNTLILFNFSKESNLTQWQIVDDVVMGGVSSGNLIINKNGDAVFSGTISLANNGGFSSIRYKTGKIELTEQQQFTIRLKGDGKSYQFRVKSNSQQYYSYAFTFLTSGNWEEINIPFNQLKPVFRGRKLDMSPYEGNQLEEISILIGNKKAENFELQLDKIEIK